MSAQFKNEKPSEECGKGDVKVNREESSKPIVYWVTLASIVVAIIIAALTVLYDCTGVAYDSEQCLWSRSLYLVTAGIFFVITWPIFLVISWGVWGSKNA